MDVLIDNDLVWEFTYSFTWQAQAQTKYEARNSPVLGLIILTLISPI